jgi:hypothetical protein
MKREKSAVQWLTRLEANDFRILPDRPVVTYADAATTLDYVILAPTLGPRVSTWQVDEALNCQHLPLLVTFSTDDGVSSDDGLTRREPNLCFSSTAGAATQALVASLLNDVVAFPTVDSLYTAIVNSFFVYGVEKKAMIVDNGSSWWRHVPTDLQSKLRELESDAQFLAGQWVSG